MHIVVIPSWYKSDQNPYMGSFFEEQARALQKAGHEVSVFFPSFYPISEIFKAKPRYAGYWNDNGLVTHAKVIQGIIPRFKRINNNHIRWQSEKLFKKYISMHGIPDIIHAHSVFDAGIIGEHLSRKYHIPLILTEHLTHFTGSLAGNTFKIELAKNVFLSASQCIAVSNQFKKDLERELNLNENVLKVVYNMVADHFYHTFVPKSWNENEEFIFFTNSFLNDRKNHILLFDSFKKLITKNPKTKFVIGGAGETEKQLQDYIKNIGIENHVEFLGGLSRQRVKEEIDKSHAFLLGSKFESFGVVLIESIISGRPVISTNCGGPAEIVDECNGYLVDSFSSDDYTAAMEKMLLNYHSFDQAKMRERCYNRFSENTIADQLLQIYDDAIRVNSNNNRNNNSNWNLSQKAASLSS